MAKDLAAIIANYFDDIVLAKYCQMCLFPSEENFIQFAKYMYQECLFCLHRDTGCKEILTLLLIIIEKNIEEFYAGKLDEKFIKKIVPPPDRNKKGQIISMLPHVNAFSNLYARINNFVNKEIELDVIHDEQAHFDEIIKYWEEALRNNEFSNVFKKHWNQSLDFDFTERFNLKFSSSKNSTGIQIADVIAGFCTRYFKLIHSNQNDLAIKHYETINLIKKLSDLRTGQGLNIVAPYTSVIKFYMI